MTMTRRWSLLTAVLIVGILAASWFLLVSPKRSEASDLRSQATKQLASNDALVQKLNELKAQSLDLPKQKAQMALMRKQLPDNPALPTLIRDLTAAGKKVGVQVLSMKPGLPVPVLVAAPVPVAAAATTSGTDTSGTAAADSGAAPAPVAPSAPVAAPLYMAPIALEITGSYFEIEQFINKLEGMQRSFLLSGFTLKAGAAPTAGSATTSTTTSTTDGLSLSLTGQVFLAPNVASSTPAAAPVAAPAQ
jgi:Tfp pilus assembly protein PilO